MVGKYKEQWGSQGGGWAGTEGERGGAGGWRVRGLVLEDLEVVVETLVLVLSAKGVAGGFEVEE